jgi:hypothetical protein
MPCGKSHWHSFDVQLLGDPLFSAQFKARSLIAIANVKLCYLNLWFCQVAAILALPEFFWPWVELSLSGFNPQAIRLALQAVSHLWSSEFRNIVTQPFLPVIRFKCFKKSYFSSVVTPLLSFEIGLCKQRTIDHSLVLLLQDGFQEDVQLYDLRRAP